MRANHTDIGLFVSEIHIKLFNQNQWGMSVQIIKKEQRPQTKFLNLTFIIKYTVISLYKNKKYNYIQNVYYLWYKVMQNID